MAHEMARRGGGRENNDAQGRLAEGAQDGEGGAIELDGERGGAGEDKAKRGGDEAKRGRVATPITTRQQRSYLYLVMWAQARGEVAAWSVLRARGLVTPCRQRSGEAGPERQDLLDNYFQHRDPLWFDRVQGSHQVDGQRESDYLNRPCFMLTILHPD